MNQEAYNQKMELLFHETVAGIDSQLLASLDEEDKIALIAAAMTERCQPLFESDPEFTEAVVYAGLAAAINSFIEERRPQGEYWSDGVIRLGPGSCVMMPNATRDDLLAWQKLETDPANLAYIETRLALWKADYKNLAELEQGETAK